MDIVTLIFSLGRAAALSEQNERKHKSKSVCIICFWPYLKLSAIRTEISPLSLYHSPEADIS